MHGWQAPSTIVIDGRSEDTAVEVAAPDGAAGPGGKHERAGVIPVGSGDASAGLAVSLLAGTGRQDALRLAGTAARANALALTAGTFTEAQVRAALDDVLVEPRRL